jgi:hypothetical protein
MLSMVQQITEAADRRAEKDREESRKLMEAQSRRNDEVMLRLTLQLDKQQATIEQLSADKAKGDDGEEVLEYAPHYDGHITSPSLAADGTESHADLYTPWQVGRERSKAAHQGGDRPRPLDIKGTPVYDTLKSKDLKKSGRYHEYTCLYSGCPASVSCFVPGAASPLALGGFLLHHVLLLCSNRPSGSRATGLSFGQSYTF